MDNRKWSHKVVKTQRGNQGKWFRYPAAKTFNSVDEASQYAGEFALEQKGVQGTKILVIDRHGHTVQSIEC
jgi:hypothetical protein